MSEFWPKFRRFILGIDTVTFLALFAGIFLLDIHYFACDLTPDDIMYAQDTENGPIVNPGSFWRSSHILWSVTTLFFHRLWQFCGYSGGAILPMQTLSIIYTALSVGILYLILHRLTRDFLVSVVMALTFHFSAWVWQAALHPKIYPSAVLFQLLSIYFICFSPPGKSRGPIMGGLCQALSILHHFATIFFVPAPLVFFLLQKTSFKTKLRDACLYLGFSLFLSFGFIYYAYRALIHCDPGPRLSFFIDWLIMRKATTGAFVAQRNLSEYFRFLNEQIVGNFPPPAVTRPDWMPTMTYGATVKRGIYGFFFLGLLAVLLGLLSLAAGRITEKMRPLSRPFQHVLASWKANLAYFCFFAAGLLLMLFAFYVVDPHNGLIFIVLAPFFLLLGLCVAPLKIPQPRSLFPWFYNGIINGALVVLMLMVLRINLASGIYPSSRIENNVELTRVLSLKKYLKSDDVIVVLGFFPDARYFQYFLGARVLEVQLLFQWYNKNSSVFGPPVDPYLKMGEIINEEVGKHRVFLYSSMFRPEIPIMIRQYPPFMGMNAERFNSFFKNNYRLIFYRQADPKAILYRLLPRSGNISLLYAIK